MSRWHRRKSYRVMKHVGRRQDNSCSQKLYYFLLFRFQPLECSLGRIPGVLVPGGDGIFSGLEFRTSLWDSYFPAASARTTSQRSQESLQTLAKRHGINPKTVARWRRPTVQLPAPNGRKTLLTVTKTRPPLRWDYTPSGG